MPGLFSQILAGDPVTTEPAADSARSAYDGDTYTDEHGRNRVVGYDAPERAGPYMPGADAARGMFQKILDSGVDSEIVGTDRYDRHLVRVESGDQDVADVMLNSGLVSPFREGSTAEDHGRVAAGTARQAVPALRTPFDEQAVAERRASRTRFDFNSQPLLADAGESATSRAIDRGIAGLEASLGGAEVYLGEKTDTEWLKAAGGKAMAHGLIGAALNPADVNSWEDADGLAQQGKFIYEKSVENLPNMATMIAGGVGGVATRAALAGIAKTAIKTAAKDVGAKALLGSTAAWRVGGMAGATFPTHMGESAMDLMQSNVQLKDVNSPFITAAVNTLLDVGPFEAMLHYSFKGLNAGMAKDLVNQTARTINNKGLWAATLQVAKEGGKGAAFSAPMEGVTEWTQELIDQTARAYYDPTYNIHSPEAQADRTEAFAAGAGVGAALGGTGRAGAAAVGRLLPPAKVDKPEGEGLQTPPHAPEQPTDLHAQVDAAAAGKKPGVLVSELQPADQAKSVADAAKAAGLASTEVPGKGTLHANPEVVEQVRTAVAANDPAKVEEAVAQATLGVASTGPSPDQVVVQTKDAQGRTVAEARAHPKDVLNVAAATAPQGATQEIKSAEQVMAERSDWSDEHEAELRELLRGTNTQGTSEEDLAEQGLQPGAADGPRTFTFRSQSDDRDQKRNLTAQAGVFAALMKFSDDRTQAIADKFELGTDEAGHATVTAEMPPREARAPDSDFGFLDALAEALTGGVTDSKNQIPFRTTLVERKGGGARQVRINGPALARAGAQLTGVDLNNAGKADQRDALNAGIAWLMERGVVPEDAAIPDTMVVVPRRKGSGEAPVLWRDVAKANRMPRVGDETNLQMRNELEDRPATGNLDTPVFDNALAREDIDTRPFTPESSQNEASKRIPATPARARLSVSGTGTKVVGHSIWLAGLHKAADVALDAAGLKGVDVTLVDTTALAQMLDDMRARRGQSRERDADIDHNIDLLEAATSAGSKGSIVFLRDTDNAGLVRPVIVISDRAGEEERPAVLLHEIGHLVLVHQLMHADDATQAALKDAFGHDQATFQENFANLFSEWAPGDPDVRDKVLNAVAAPENAVSTIFKAIDRALRAAWRALSKQYEKSIPAFSDFMKAWLGVVHTKPAYPSTELGKAFQKALKDQYGMNSPVIRPLLPRDAAPVEHLEFTPFEKIKGAASSLAARNAKAKRVIDLGAKTGKSFGETVGYIYNAWLQPLDSVLRAMHVPAVTKMADHFFRPPRSADSQVHGATVHHEITMQESSFADRIAKIAEAHVGAFRPWHLLPGFKAPEPSAEMKTAVDELIAGVPRSPLAKEIGGFFNDMYGWLRKQGVYVRQAQNYFPRAWNKSKLAEDYAGFKSAVIRWAQTDEGKAWFRKKREDLGQLPRGVTAGEAAAFADNLYGIFTSGEGVLDLSEHSDPNAEEFEFMSPGFSYGKKRTLPGSLVDELRAYREEDVVQLMTSYLRAAVKRGVWQKRFGLNDEITKINKLYDNARRAVGSERERLFTRANEFKDQRVKFYQDTHDVNLYDPAAGLKVDLRTAYDEGKLSDANYRRIVDQVIPAYQGMLGADKVSPKWRRFQALMMVYQNLRVLSLSVLSQFVDPALVAARIPQGYRAGLFAAAAKMATHKPTREDMMNDARLLGLVRDDITDHILNDDAGVMLATRNIQRVNEWFFRVNGMHFLTNVWRAAALSMGKRLVKEWAEKGDTQQLAELGMTPDDVKAWIADGESMAWANKHSAVLGGFNQFVDEGVMRPTPMSRPAIGSDHRYQLFWHLKSFTWTYATTVLQRVWVETTRKFGQEDGARKALAMLPALTLMAWTLPAAALGMELRWLIAPPKQEFDRGGWDYFWQMVQRSGLLGVGQMMADMNDAESHGQLPLLAPLGPTVSQVIEFSQKDFGTAMGHAVPAYPIVNFAGRAFQ